VSPDPTRMTREELAVSRSAEMVREWWTELR
jgi:hypothetical protein